MSQKPLIFKFDTRANQAEAIVNALVAAINHGIESKGFANIALSGGSTPEAVYARLAHENLDWKKVNIALVDERWVDVTSDASNEKMIRRAFAVAKGVNVIPLKTDDESPNNAVAKIDAIYSKLRPFDAIVLGMGPDAHTASWFSGANGLEQILRIDCAKTIAAIDAKNSEIGGKYPERITMTLPPIAQTQMLLLLINGQEKIEVLEQSVTGDARSMPIKAAIDAASHGLTVFWAK